MTLPESLASLLLGDDDVGLPRDVAGSADHLDVHDASLLEPDAPAELARLRTRGFLAGAVRSWVGDDESVVQITLHRFVNPSGMLAVGANVMRPTSASGTPITTSPRSQAVRRI